MMIGEQSDAITLLRALLLNSVPLHILNSLFSYTPIHSVLYCVQGHILHDKIKNNGFLQFEQYLPSIAS